MPNKPTLHVETVFHYTEDDLGGDYTDVEVIVDGKLAASYGDHYHDKGCKKAEGFVDGLIFVHSNAQIIQTVKNIDDRE